MIVDVSSELPLLALRSVVVLPGTTVPVEIGRTASLKLVDDLAGRGVGLLVGVQKDPDVEAPARGDLHDICVEGAVVSLVGATERRRTLVVRGVRRRRITGLVRGAPYLVATSEPVLEPRVDEVALSQLHTDLARAIDKLVAAGQVPVEAADTVKTGGNVEISDRTAALLDLPAAQQVALLLELDVGRRRYRLLQFLEQLLAKPVSP